MGDHRQGRGAPPRRLALTPASRLPRGRAGLALLAVLAGAAAGARADAPVPTQPRVRVLLLETGGSVLVREGAGPARATRVEPAPGGLLADSRPVGSVWRVESGGVLHVGDYRVRGALEVLRVPLGLQVVNRVALEDYVAGTVAREVYPDWAPEMLKAQAVVARTYALHQRGRHPGRAFDVRGGTSGQVYGGVDAETPAVWAAVRVTRGEYLADSEGPILAVYHSASGGRTASAEEVWGRPVAYLVSVPVEGEEDSPDTYWRASVSGTTLGRALAALGIRVGPVRELRVSERSPSGRALRLKVRGADGSESLEARVLRSVLGEQVIRSTLFEIRAADAGFVFVGSGHGHGVGMSQWGGQAMAVRGASYREILAAFYPGTELRR
ncbi:MAG: SpoIID/LytB domain-containing protein [Myxococcales bacterium]|nr:SpoIID/LytB domain-containing protein [Myxococcales bacterium]